MNHPLLEINHVALHVINLAASDNFYGEVLGLQKLLRPDFDFPGSWYGIGDQELHLIVDEGLHNTNKGSHHFAVLVDDVYAVKEELIQKGYTRMQEPQRRPDGAMQLFVTDPDGYLVEFCSLSPNSAVK